MKKKSPKDSSPANAQNAVKLPKITTGKPQNQDKTQKASKNTTKTTLSKRQEKPEKQMSALKRQDLNSKKKERSGTTSANKSLVKNDSKGKTQGKNPKNIKEIREIKDYKQDKRQSSAGKGKLGSFGSKNNMSTINSNNIKTVKSLEEKLLTEQTKEREEEPRITKEKLAQIQKQRKIRLQREKEEEKKDKEMFDKLLSEVKGKNKSQRENLNLDDVKVNPVKISEKRAQSILENGGMLDAYKHLIIQLCKNGLPNGNLFEYAAYVIKNYEKKWKEKKSQMMKEKVDKYWEEKKKRVLEENLKAPNPMMMKILNRSLEEREMNKYIKSLDKSRSTRLMKQPRSLGKSRENKDFVV